MAFYGFLLGRLQGCNRPTSIMGHIIALANHVERALYQLQKQVI